MRRSLPPSRSRRFAKWAGLVVCVLILVVWAVSMRLSVRWERRSNPHVSMVLSGGVLTGLWSRDTAFRYYGSFVSEHPFRLGIERPQLDVSRPRPVRDRRGIVVLPYASTVLLDSGWSTMIIPLWIPIAICLAPTLILWHRDRRTVKPGCCLTCGYDLRASNKTCPECGTAIANPTK